MRSSRSSRTTRKSSRWTRPLFQAVPVGANSATPYRLLLVRPPDFGDTSLPIYGLIDESAKLNIDYATSDMMQQMGMTPELADSIVDWRDADSEVTGSDGAEDELLRRQAQPLYREE